MSELFSKRLVIIESEETIDSMPQGAVVYVKNSPPRVFDGKDGDMVRFYFHYVFMKENVVQLETPRDCICQVGNMIAFTPSGHDKKVYLTPDNGEPYRQRRDDLVALGLMRE